MYWLLRLLLFTKIDKKHINTKFPTIATVLSQIFADKIYSGWLFLGNDIGSLSLWPRNYLKKFSMNCCTVHYFFIPLYVIVRKQQKLIVCILDLLKLKMVRWLIFKSR